jgi:hypothetical protein
MLVPVLSDLRARESYFYFGEQNRSRPAIFYRGRSLDEKPCDESMESTAYHVCMLVDEILAHLL